MTTDDHTTDDHTTAERDAPLSTAGPLPFRVATLEFIPPARRGQYARQMDGSFALAWVEDGGREHLANLEAVANGTLRLFVAGTTAEDARQTIDRQAVLDKAVAVEMARLEAEEVAHKKARLDAKLAQARARHEKELANELAKLRGEPTSDELAELAEVEALVRQQNAGS
ncbi:MAG: hypothetical protein WD771_08775 [Gemmatimonadaceae bacterium]